MHALFGDVLWIVLAVGVLASLWAMRGASKEWEAYSERGLYMESVRTGSRPSSSPAREAAERDSEIRQMVEAANARRLRRGQPARDVEAEIARLSGEGAGSDMGAGDSAIAGARSGPYRLGSDPELEAEVRALVELRNQRRVRKGQEALDVETEMVRELDELSMLRH